MTEFVAYGGGGPTTPLSPGRQLHNAELMRTEVRHAVHLRDHYWTAILLFKVVPPLTDKQMFDADSYRDITIGCYICEESWQPRIGKRPCKGWPRHHEPDWFAPTHGEENP